MTVSARPAKDLLLPATPEPPVVIVDMRGGTRVRAGSYSYEGHDVVTGWHAHDLHQIEYAFEGVAEVETSTAHYLLPPQQAAWIPAVDETADAYFDALARLAGDWLEHEAPLCLPTSSDPVVSAVMEYTRERLAGVTVADVCAAVGVSERTLRRLFGEATGITWRRYLLEGRLLRAMALLTEPGRTVMSVSVEVGFDSVSAFTRAFARFAGETPSAYRSRVLHDPDQSNRPV